MKPALNQTTHIKLLQKNLLAWYQKNKRNLPWRETKNPYFIWVSEIMLQQTRVDTAIPYYERFIKKFPTIDALALESEHEVLKLWQGLGYYRRAKLIHKAAKEVSQHYEGQLPSTRAELQELPGFGPYTSGAVASIAFNECAPAIDGNVKRVLSRIFSTHDSVEAVAQEAAQVNAPSEWTQALMELGALICIPKNPKCLVCPVNKICKSCESGTVEKYPALTKKTKIKEVFATTWMIEHPNKKMILIQQRPESGRWSNMWEFPTDESEKKQIPKSQPFSFKSGKHNHLGSFKHQLTHQTIHVEVMHARSKNPVSLSKNQKWVSSDHLDEFPISKMQLKAFEIFQQKMRNSMASD